ncbi:MAG: J domain-containing protein [bacterium]|nr:J domain-containing protein [bacterium]
MRREEGEEGEEVAVDLTATYTEYSKEWRAQQDALRDPEEKRDLLPAAELFVPDELSGKTPYEIFGVSEGDDIEAHKAYRTLMRSLHPDIVNAEIDKVIKQALGGSDVAWQMLKAYTSKFDDWLEKQQETLTEEQLAALSEDERNKYVAEFRSWEENKPSEDSIVALKEELKQRAGKKAQILNIAWDKIKKGLSYENIVGLASVWTTSIGESRYLMPHQIIRLEGDAELYRDLDFTVTDTGEVVLGRAHPAYLAFAFGYDQQLGIYEQYREFFPLKHLFAFLEHRDGRRVNSALLSDIAEEHNLTAFDVRTLQDLLSQQAELSRMCEELRIEPLFEEPSLFANSAVKISDVVRVLVHYERLNDEDKKRFMTAGYTIEALATLESFVSVMRKKAEESLRNWNNSIIYDVARQRVETFAQVKREGGGMLYKSDEENEGFLAGEILRDLRDAQSKPERFTRAILEILDGPTYTLHENDVTGYRVGIEFGRDGLRLLLPKQESLNHYDFSSLTEVFFNRNDLGVMREVAYGRSLSKGGAKAIDNKRS